MVLSDIAIAQNYTKKAQSFSKKKSVEKYMYIIEYK